jgi:uncharacterized protein YjiS (DUF1127 family)
MYEYFLIDRQIISRAGEERTEVLPRIAYLAIDAIDRSVRSVAGHLRKVASSVVARHRQFVAGRSTALALSKLDDRMLRDIGVAREEIWSVTQGLKPWAELEIFVMSDPVAVAPVKQPAEEITWRKAA